MAGVGPRNELTAAVLAATTLCPRIIAAAVIAEHGPPGGRLDHLQDAQRHCRELLARFECAEIFERTAQRSEEAAP